MLELAGVDTVYDSTPWCGAWLAFVTWLLDIPRPTLPARARSWLTVGRPVAVASAEVGWDVVVLARGGGDQPGPEVLDAPGHVGFFAGRSADAGSVLVLGGNQGDAVGIASYPASRVLGVRRLRRLVEP